VHAIKQTYLNGIKWQSQALMTCSIDDSIYFQAKIGREKECEAALQRLRGENADISQEAAEIRVTSSLHTSMRE
jgi:type II secretory pathway component PulM